MSAPLDLLEEQAEKLRNAVKALASFTRTPQERLDGALSYFMRTFRDAPEAGEALDHYTAVYDAIGNPPVGTTVQVRHEGLSAEELDTVSHALVDLCDAVVRQCEEARRLTPGADAAGDAPAIDAGQLDSLIPGRGWSR